VAGSTGLVADATPRGRGATRLVYWGSVAADSAASEEVEGVSRSSQSEVKGFGFSSCGRRAEAAQPLRRAEEPDGLGLGPGYY
jgi:hypothetical protein